MSQSVLTPNEFSRLSKAKRAILIAEDVILQIKLGTYKPGHHYATNFANVSHLNWDEEAEFNDKDASEFLKTAKKSEIRCTGCARASLFISAIKFKNQLSIGEVYNTNFNYKDEYDSDDDPSGTQYLSEEFDRWQQGLIESAFEGIIYGAELIEEDEIEPYHDDWKDSWDTDSEEKHYRTAKARNYYAKLVLASKMRDKYLKKWKTLERKGRLSKDNYVLTQICKNIIKNNGVFVPA